MSVDVALVTWRDLPELDPDDRPLATALRDRGHRVAIVAWDDPAFDWTQVRLVLLRNPWDYYRRPGEFVEWAARVDGLTQLLNPLAAVRWNVDKRYLVELAALGAPVVPTRYLEPGTAPDLAALFEEAGPAGLVIKPAVSADSWETLVARPRDQDRARAHLDRLLPDRALLVQPFLASVETHREHCLVFLEGAFSHAVAKNPLTRGGRWAGLPEGTPVEPESDELAAAETILATAARALGTLPAALLYARVDLLRDDDGRPLLLELELVEPTLFLADHPAGLARFVAALERLLPPDGQPE